MKTLALVMTLALPFLLAGCGACGNKPAGSGSAPVVSSTPEPSMSPVASPTPADPIACKTTADCPAGTECRSFEGCGPAAQRCEAPVGCTDDLAQYCGCDGKTIEGSGSCPPAPYRHRGPCE